MKRRDESDDDDKENDVNQGNSTSDVEFVSESSASSSEKQIRRLTKKLNRLKRELKKEKEKMKRQNMYVVDLTQDEPSTSIGVVVPARSSSLPNERDAAVSDGNEPDYSDSFLEQVADDIINNPDSLAAFADALNSN